MDNLKDNISELFCLTDRVHNAWHNITPKQSLSRTQFAALLGIYRLGSIEGKYVFGMSRPVSLTELAGTCWQSLPALSQRVFALEKMGYIQRIPKPLNRRVIGLVLTPFGIKATEEARTRLYSVLKRTFTELKTDGDTVIKLLSELVAAFEIATKCEEDE